MQRVHKIKYKTLIKGYEIIWSKNFCVWNTTLKYYRAQFPKRNNLKIVYNYFQTIFLCEKYAR